MVDKGDSSGTVEVTMDTPDRTKTQQINAPAPKFEDSPVFNFLNSLSPIKPVKSVHITQTFNPLSFSSIPSVFTSPHVTSLKESRFLRRHQLGDPSKPEFASDNATKDDTNEVIIESTEESSDNIPSYTIQTLDFTPNREIQPKFMSNGSSSIQFIEEESDQNKESTQSDWESLMSDANELLNFDSPIDNNNSTDPSTKSNEPETNYFNNNNNNNQQVFESNELENQFTQPGDDNNNASSLDVNCLVTEPVDSVTVTDPENCNLYRGMRRRCLVFEMSGARFKHLSSNINVKTLNESSSSNSSSSRCVLPKGIGLHLNALSTTSKNYQIVKNEALSSGRQLLIASASSVNDFQSNKSLINTKRELENEAPVLEDGSQDNIVNEEFNQNSPKKKRRKENGEGGESSGSCKRCNCKKSKCLKLYCECFAAGVYCVEPCSCLDCFNKPIHEDTVLATRKQIESRNPLAFAPKVIRTNDQRVSSETPDDSSKTPASARHKRGCNCKKSGCLKKYCECYQGGVGCSINCRCEGCKNVFGKKDGSSSISCSEVETEEEINTSQKSVIECDAEYVHPATPLPFGGPLMQVQFNASKNKPPRSSHIFTTSQGFGKPNLIPQHKFGRVTNDEMPEILQMNGSPISGGIKSTSSPNSKRVSPPHHTVTVTGTSSSSSPGQRSSRKLILQSIPSFPSLDNQRN